MAEYEIVKRLEYCINNQCDICQEENGSGFPWVDGRCYGFTERVCDVVALLKAQDNTVCTKERCPMNVSTISDDCNIKTCPWRTEAVEPKRAIGEPWYECPVCGRHLTQYEDNYCSRCGKRVKWRD